MKKPPLFLSALLASISRFARGGSSSASVVVSSDNTIKLPGKTSAGSGILKYRRPTRRKRNFRYHAWKRVFGGLAVPDFVD